jgi:hypothetical protein
MTSDHRVAVRAMRGASPWLPASYVGKAIYNGDTCKGILATFSGTFIPDYDTASVTGDTYQERVRERFGMRELTPEETDSTLQMGSGTRIGRERD